MSLCKTALCKLLTPFKREFAYVALLSLVSNLMMLTPTIYMLQLYDRVMLSHNEITLVSVTIIAVFFLAVMAVSEWLRSKLVIYAGMRFDQSLNWRILEVSLNQHQRLDAQQSNQLLKDLTSVRQFVTGNGVFAFFDLPWSVLYVLVLFILSPKLGMVALLFSSIQLALALWNEKTTHDATDKVMSSQIKQQYFIQGKIRNIETLHVMGILPPLFQRWSTLNELNTNHEAQLLSIQSRNQMVNKFVRYTMQSLMLAVAAYLVIQNEISVGSMIASNVLIGRALQPFDVIVSTWQQYVQAENSAKNMTQVLNSADRFDSPKLKPTLSGNIQLHELSIEFGKTTVVKKLSAKFETGKINTIMGASGSGKTTLAKAIVGLVKPTAGQLLIDGTQILDIDRSFLSQSVGYLPQDVLLIEGTIAENISRFGELNSDEIIRASQAVGLHETILRMKKGYDTLLDEFGHPLSGGQKQLVGLARAIYKSPQLLVLDEPNASLDEFGEQHLANVLQGFKAQNKTVIVISHRKGLLQISDTLMVLKSGELQQYTTLTSRVA